MRQNPVFYPHRQSGKRLYACRAGLQSLRSKDELPVKQQLKSERKISIASYDYTYFCDIAYDKEQPVIFHCDESVQPQYTVYQDKNNPIYYNPLGAITDTRVYYEWQPGLQTYYPIEIVVTY